MVAPTDDNNFESLREQADALVTALADALAAVQQGVPLEMDGLDIWVSEICQGATTLPAAQARALLPQLDGVVAGMDALSAALARQHDDLLNAASRQPDPATARQRAVSAYASVAPPAPIAVPVNKPPAAVSPPATHKG